MLCTMSCSPRRRRLSREHSRQASLIASLLLVPEHSGEPLEQGAASLREPVDLLQPPERTYLFFGAVLRSLHEDACGVVGGDARWAVRCGFAQALLFLQVAGDPNDVLVGAGVALLGDLPPDPGGVAAALLPAPHDVVLVGCDGTYFLRKVASHGRGLEGQVLLHRVAMYPELSGYLGVLHAFLRKGVDGSEELLRLLFRALF